MNTRAFGAVDIESTCTNLRLSCSPCDPTPYRRTDTRHVVLTGLALRLIREPVRSMPDIYSLGPGDWFRPHISASAPNADDHGDDRGCQCRPTSLTFPILFPKLSSVPWG